MGGNLEISWYHYSKRPHVIAVVMRYLIDTNIFVYMATDRGWLHNDILSILQDYDNVLYMSSESVKELTVAYTNKGLCNKRWKTAKAMVDTERF